MHCFKSCNYEAVLSNKTIIISIQIFSKPTSIKQIKMFFFSLPCPVPSYWISAHPAMICVHHAYHSRGFSAGRGTANQKQSVTKFVMGADSHSSVGLVANLNALSFFGPGLKKVIESDETGNFQHPSLTHFFSSRETRVEMYFISEANG